MSLRSFAAVCFLFAVACASVPRVAPPPPAFGFHTRVDAHRPIRCVVDADMTPERCVFVLAAVDKINVAVGFELLQAPQIMRGEEFVEEAPRGLAVTYVAIDKLPPGVLGLTGLRKSTAFVLLAPFIWADPAMRDSVVLHELLHSVGADHAPQRGAWGSVERPAWAPGAPTELTDADVASLRAAYDPR